MQPLLDRSAADQPMPPIKPPKVVAYYRIYAGLLSGVYAFTIPMGALLLSIGHPNPSAPGVPPWITGLICLIVGPPLCAAYAVGVFGGRRRWRHTYGIVLLAIGMTSMCCLPATIPLLIFWLKPETKSWFSE